MRIFFLILAIITTPLGPPVERRAAGFIVTYPQFVTWPEKSSHISVGIVGSNPIGKAGVEYLEQHGFKVRKLRYSQRDRIPHVQILIVGDMPKKQLKKMLKELAEEPVLTVGTDPNFMEMGGIIQMTINFEQRAVTWRVDMENAKRAGLKVNPSIVQYGQTM